jgi:uncharacterized protein (UPF0261 family)
MAGLMRFVKKVVWNNVAKAAGDVSDPVDVSKVDKLLVFVKVSAATTITLQVLSDGTYEDYDSLTFSAAGQNWWNIWSLAADYIRFKTSNAATITIIVKEKT